MVEYRGKQVGFSVYQKIDGDGRNFIVRITPEGTWPCLFQGDDKEAILHEAIATLTQANEEWCKVQEEKKERMKKAREKKCRM